MTITLQKSATFPCLHEIFITLKYWYVDQNKNQQPQDSYLQLKRRIEMVVNGKRVEKNDYSSRLKATRLKDRIPIVWHELWGIFNGDMDILQALHIINASETNATLTPNFTYEIRRNAAEILVEIIREQLGSIIDPKNITDQKRSAINENLTFLVHIANKPAKPDFFSSTSQKPPAYPKIT
jgi:hypothetical protein